MPRCTKMMSLLSVGLIGLIGCGEARPTSAVGEMGGTNLQYGVTYAAAKSEMPAPPAPAPRGVMPSMGMMGGMMAKGAPAPAAADRPESAAPIPPAVDRKIVYNARVEMNVIDLTASEKALKELVAQTKGYISETDVSGNTGSKRRGTWKARIPVEGFSDFLSAVIKLGELQTNHTDSQDVTAEYYDVDARIKNKLQEEVRLKKILDEAAGKLKDILEVEKEITRVRGEVEQMQGRLRVLASLSSLSTVTITMAEVETFKPVERPTFAQLIARTFRESTERLTMYLGNIVLAIVDFIPWLTLWVPALAALWVAIRVVRRWLKNRPPGEPAIPPGVAPVVTS